MKVFICVPKSEYKCKHKTSHPVAAVDVHRHFFSCLFFFSFARCVVFNNRGVGGEELLVSTTITLYDIYIADAFSQSDLQ